MSLTLVFLLVLLVCFAFVVLFTKPSQTEVAVRRRFASLADEDKAKPVESTILKQDKLSPTPWLDELLARVPGSIALLDLIKQAGSDWWVSSVIFGSMLCVFVGWFIASLRFQSSAAVFFSAFLSGCIPIGYLFVQRY